MICEWKNRYFRNFFFSKLATLSNFYLEGAKIQKCLKESKLSAYISMSLQLHALKNLPFQFTPVTHMVYLEIRLHYLDFAIEKLTSSNWISKYTMCVTGVN